jgi:hypothetical protein
MSGSMRISVVHPLRACQRRGIVTVLNATPRVRERLADELIERVQGMIREVAGEQPEQEKLAPASNEATLAFLAIAPPVSYTSFSNSFHFQV